MPTSLWVVLKSQVITLTSTTPYLTACRANYATLRRCALRLSSIKTSSNHCLPFSVLVVKPVASRLLVAGRSLRARALAGALPPPEELNEGRLGRLELSVCLSKARTPVPVKSQRLSHTS